MLLSKFRNNLNLFFFKTLSVLKNEDNTFERLHNRISDFTSSKKGSFLDKKSREKYQEQKYLDKLEWYARKNRLKDVVVYKLVFKVTRNNVFITVMDPFGRYVFYSSGGLNYFFLRRRTVAVANILLGENLGLELKSKLVCFLDLEFHGLPFKSHRLNFIKGLVSSGITIRNIIDKTPISHNGCSWKKKRRKKFNKRR